VVLRLALAASLVSLAFSVGNARADGVEGTTFRSSKFAIQLVAPRGWTLTDQATFPDTNYPGILVVATRGPALISLAAQAIDPQTETLKTYAQKNADAIGKVGFKKVAPLMPRGGVLTLDASTGAKVLRQAYLVHGAFAYVLTIVLPITVPQAQMSDFFNQFDVTVRGLSFGP
jgi:hypothetical protein